MPKDIPDCPKKPEPAREAVQEFEIELITPMFGGGVEPRVNDPSCPIRATAIRGQLRFWWRATRGWRCPGALALWQREEEVFGSTRFPSPVRVHVKLDPKTEPAFAEASEVDRFGPGGYALFALQHGDRLIREGLKFQVTLTWLPVPQLNRQRAALNDQLAKAKQPLLPAAVSDITDDLRDAVWAWVNFGGLGSRTRRGCGALYCKELAPKSIDMIAGWFRTAFERFGTSAAGAALCPRLAAHLFHQPKPLSPIAAWQSVMSLFKTFRQGEGVGAEPRTTTQPTGEVAFPGTRDDPRNDPRAARSARGHTPAARRCPG